MKKIPKEINSKGAEIKKIPQGIYFITSGLLFLIGAIVLVWWTSSYNSWKLREQLQILSPLFLEIIFFLIIVAIGINIKTFKEVFSGISRRMWLFLGGVTLIGLLITMFVVPRAHRIYYDEDIYQNIGQNIAFLKDADANRGEDLGESMQHLWKRIVGRAAMCNEGKNEYGEYSCYKLEYNKEPNGWAYTLSVVFRLFGVHEIVAFLTTNFLYGVSILTVFFIGYLLFGSTLAGIFAALVLAMTPELMIWSNTTAVEPSAAVFPGLALLCALIFIKKREMKTLFLAVVMAAFAVQFRPESIMFLAVIGLLILLLRRDELVKGEFYLLISIFFVLIIPHLVHLWAVKEMGWGSSGPKFSSDFFQNNFRVNGLFYLKNLRYPLVFTLLAGLGLVLKRGQEGVEESSFFLKEKIVVFIWFLLFWGIFLFFYAGSYNYGADVRFSLLSAMPIAVIAGNGAASLSQLLIKRLNLKHVNYFLTASITFAFLPFLPFVRAITQEAWGARADHHYAKEMVESLPADSIVLTHNPNMFLFWGKSAAQASLVTEQRNYFNRFFYRYKGGIYFHYNFWCNVPDRLQNSFCTNILEKFDCEPVESFKEKSYTFELYKLEKKTKKSN